MRTGMRAAVAAWVICTGVLLAGIETSAQSMPKEAAARVELYAIPSLTLSDQQFLTGDASGKPVTVAGEFRIAQGSGRLPVVVLMHGSSGVGANIEPWTHQFNKMGISTFVIDGFTGRGLTAVGPNQALLGRLNLIVDIYRSLEILAKHPRVDPERIVLMGFSRGGQATLYASLDRFNKLWNKSGVQFSGYIPFYPDCSTTYLTDTEIAARPIRIFHGTPDDYNPVASCKAYVARLQNARRDVVLTEYPDSAHGFDVGLARRLHRRGLSQCADRAALPPRGRRRRRAGEYRYPSAVRLQGCLHRAQPACRRQSRDGRRSAQGGERFPANAVQAWLGSDQSISSTSRRWQSAPSPIQPGFSGARQASIYRCAASAWPERRRR